MPTLTCTWMRKGQQRKVLAPGTNEKRSVAAATDVGDGALLWRTDARRCVAQFSLLVHRCVQRSTARRRLAVVLVDNAQSHRLGKTGMMRTFMDAYAGQVVLVFLPPYSPDLQPAERLWRQWRPNVTHNHVRATIEELVADSDAWLSRQANDPAAVLRALGDLTRSCSEHMAA